MPKSDKSGKQNFNGIKHGSIVAEDPISIGNIFNTFLNLYLLVQQRI